ncbi:MAG: bifunctional 5,10-methylenetetrahydrofolate dehydrogenase/5,10-methenyltetrahydrofolate cyclohydrolase [Candidatus Paceibacterota bacterium]
MIVDGRAIAADIYREIENAITHLDTTPHLTVFTCAPNFETQKYLDLKRRKAQAVGIGVNVIEFPATITTEEVVQSINHAAMQTDGIIVQLPFPAHVDAEEVLKNIPPSLDVDAMHYDGTATDILPPVVGAIATIAQRHDVLFATSQTLIIGQGRLVGAPAKLWAEKMGAQVSVVTKGSKDIIEKLHAAQIIITGAGVAGLVRAEQVMEGVIIFDAGTSEEGGELRGDVDPACVEKATLFTPVPGGIGPITVAILLRNLVRLVAKR